MSGSFDYRANWSADTGIHRIMIHRLLLHHRPLPRSGKDPGYSRPVIGTIISTVSASGSPNPGIREIRSRSAYRASMVQTNHGKASDSGGPGRVGTEAFTSWSATTRATHPRLERSPTRLRILENPEAPSAGTSGPLAHRSLNPRLCNRWGRCQGHSSAQLCEPGFTGLWDSHDLQSY